MFVSRDLALTRDFALDVARLGAFNQRRLGLRVAPVAAIVGSVGRTDLLSPSRMAVLTRSSRYRAILNALADGHCLPPVDLYSLAGLDPLCSGPVSALEPRTGAPRGPACVLIHRNRCSAFW